MAVAVISLGGKQFTVQPGKIIDVPHLKQEPGQTLELTDLLHGQPVGLKVIDQHKGPKIRIIKFKAKTRYTRTQGYRSQLTRLEVTKIGS